MSGANYSKNAETNNGREQDGIPEPLKRIREHTIRMLKDAADTADTIHQSFAGKDMGANATGFFGGVAAGIGGGLATFATGGLADPAMLTAFSLTSGGFSIVGGCWSIKNGYDREKEFEILQKRIWAIVSEDEREIHDMFKEILQRRSVRDGGVLDPAQVFREVHAGVAGVFYFVKGSGNISTLINRIPSVTNIISHGADGGFPILSGVATEVCGHTAVQSSIFASARLIEKEVGKKVADKGASEVTKTVTTECIASKTTKTLAKMTLEEVCEEVTERAAKKVAMEATEEGAKIVSKQLAKNGAKAGAKTVAKASTETVVKASTETVVKASTQTAVKASAQTTAKVAGAVTMVFGGITIAWEGYNYYQNYYATKEKSQLGKELRKLASKLEISLKTGKIPF